MIQKNTLIILAIIVVVLTLSAVYAAITNVQLSIVGNATATPDQANFQVAFTNPISYSGTGTAVANITSDTTATIDVTGLTSVGDKNTTILTVTNKSKDLSTYLTCAATNYNTEYFKVTTTLGKALLAPKNNTTTLSVTVELIKTPIAANVTDTVNVALTANPTEGSLISFTVNGTTYLAEEGMTWAEWIATPYNTGGFYTNYGLVYKNNISPVLYEAGTSAVVESYAKINQSTYY